MICLTFDTDHVDEHRMREFMHGIRLPGRATFFCTRCYDCLSEEPHEVCAHPFLEPGGDWSAALQAARRDFPEAQGWRSHSCVYSHMVALQLAEQGYSYASTHTELGRIGAKPFKESWGLWHIPIYYMDNLDFSYQRFWPSEQRRAFSSDFINAALHGDGVYVFDFHPVHLLLNSPSADWYLAQRGAFAEGVDLEDIRYSGYGAADFFSALCVKMEQAGLQSHTLFDALQPYVEKDAAALSRPA